MNVRVKFLGGAGTVTGSKYLLEIDDYKLLVDCGLFQGQKDLRNRNWETLPIDPSQIDAVVLTHAHIDHSGYLPLFCKNGFKGSIHCTLPTADLLEIMLSDSAKLQEEEAEFARKKQYTKHDPPKPLYTLEDAQLVFPLLTPHVFDERITLTDEVHVHFFNAGHILGAASVEVTILSSQGEKTIVFSGDIGPFKNPLHSAPTRPRKADILFIESTYGDRDKEEVNVEMEIKEVLRKSDNRNGVVLIPAFSVGRTQLVLYYLWKIFQNMPSRPVYVDSPMAISVTHLYKQYEGYHRLHSKHGFGHHIFDAPFVHYVRDQDRSKFLNTIKNNAIIISASGMATGGRVLHHLFHRVQNEQDIVMFTGFLPDGTRGKTLTSGEPNVNIFGEEVPVKAEILNLDSLSAHADQSDLVNWTDLIRDKPKMTFIVHGEESGNQGLSKLLSEKGWNTTIPAYLDNYHLFEGI